MGLPFSFVKGEGPSFDNPLKSESDIDRLRAIDPRDELRHVLDAIRLAREALDGRVPLIGFAGAPFTLASYAIEGGPSRDFAKTKSLMCGHPDAWHRLCELLAGVVSEFLLAQVNAGAQVIQVFDSWVGSLNSADYREFVLPHSKRILDAVKATGVPTIHFGTGIVEHPPRHGRGGRRRGRRRLAHPVGRCVAVDWRGSRDSGNLDPTSLLGPRHRLFRAAEDVLRRAGGRPGHIFNLGHGILPMTPCTNVQALCEVRPLVPYGGSARLTPVFDACRHRRRDRGTHHRVRPDPRRQAQCVS